MLHASETDGIGFTAATARVLAMLRDPMSVSDASRRLFLEQAIDLLRTQLVLGEGDRPNPPVSRRGLAPWQVTRVTSYMRERLESEIGLNELAALVDLSRFHFCTAFRLATGRTPHEWLTHERMARAKTLLANPKVRVTDVALAVGYGTPSAFAATFRKVVGQAPTEFRRGL